MTEINISQADQGRTIEAHIGDVIHIKLPENPTTGYQWELISAELQGVELTATDYEPPTTNAIGAGGMKTFSLRAQSNGTATLQFTLKRSWEATGIEQFNVTIQVQ